MLSIIHNFAVLKGDIDDDGSVNNLDITPFIGLLTGTGSQRNRRTQTQFARLRCTGLDDGAEAQTHVKSNR